MSQSQDTYYEGWGDAWDVCVDTFYEALMGFAETYQNPSDELKSLLREVVELVNDDKWK